LVLEEFDMRKQTYNIELYYDKDEKMFTVTVPALPGCVPQGKDIEQCIDRAREAILCHIEGLRKATLQDPDETWIHSDPMCGAVTTIS
jgi:antitoxin HicB